MKTKVKKIATIMDNAIEDVTMEYAKEAGTQIMDDVLHAGIGIGTYYMYLGFAILHTAELAGRTAKTGVKKAAIKAKELYDETDTTVTVRR